MTITTKAKTTSTELARACGSAKYLMTCFEIDKKVYGEDSHTTNSEVQALQFIIDTLQNAYEIGVE